MGATCDSCGHKNRKPADFCAQCGASLPARLRDASSGEWLDMLSGFLPWFVGFLFVCLLIQRIF